MKWAIEINSCFGYAMRHVLLVSNYFEAHINFRIYKFYRI